MMFNLTESQQKKISDWMATLPEAYTGAIGGRFEYAFNPTNVGVIVIVRDAVTKTEINVTEDEDW